MDTPKETLETFKSLKAGLTREEFIERYPHPFLVEDISSRKAEMDNFEFATLHISSDELKAMIGGTSGMPLNTPVHRVAKRATNAFEGMINVGRAGNNDIVLDYQAVSKFHAYFTKDPIEDTYYLTDADSTNHSYINGHELTPHQKTELHEGDLISFGRQADLTYYLPGGFYDLLGA